MLRRSIPFGRVLGIPLGLDPSWFLIFALVTWSLATVYAPLDFRSWPVLAYWAVGAATAILFFASVVLHELGHLILAVRNDIPVRRITLFFFGGVSQISSGPPSPRAEFWIGVAGPVVSFELAALFGLLQFLFAGIAPLAALFRYLAYLNAALAIFNLIPAFPLDGGRVFRAAIWAVAHNLRRATAVAVSTGRGIAYLFILVGAWMAFSGRVVNGVWTAFLGWFLWGVAEAEGQSVIGMLALCDVKKIPRREWATTTAAEAMVPGARVKKALPNEQLQDALAEMERDGLNQLPVMVDGHCLGMLRREDLVNLALRSFHSQHSTSY